MDSGSSFEDETDVSNTSTSKTYPDVCHELTPTLSESSIVSKVNTKPFEEQVISDLEILKCNQEQHTLVLNELLRTIRSHSLESLQKPLDLPNVPINSKHDYRAWEECLQNPENANYMVISLFFLIWVIFISDISDKTSSSYRRKYGTKQYHEYYEVHNDK